MPRKRILNGLPNSLEQRYFSTLFFWEKYYMADWIWYEAYKIGATDIEIDIMNDSVVPRELEIRPIIAQLVRLRETIVLTLKANYFPSDFIVEARFKINISQKWKMRRLFYCKAILTDREGRVYEGKTYTEQATDLSN